MPTDLGTRWPPTFTGHPAHMSPEDEEIWNRWFPRIRSGTLALYFDVGLGQGKIVDGPEPPQYKKMWIRNNQKRADVIVVREKELWLVELRFQASPNALGRLKTYERLWQEDPVIPGPLIPYLVTNALDPEVEATAKDLGITYIIA